MTSDQFFYWLQGYFELCSAEVPPLSDHQIECIVRHDRLVAEANQGRRGEQMIKIGVMLELMREGTFDRAKGTEAIRRMVSHQFEHVIDPAAGDAAVQEKLNQAHHGEHYQIGGYDPKTGAVYRC